ncbi:hypothetical protein JZY91_01140 [Corynebacterium sp. CNCTC7651]|uniref:hypothetical protein n=1 Tax=Corynebacterium sp. CNCTC7651 TaxID=2815361 RepID=UPI001F1B98CA|nr:hypothetical protein [Corynebacterium sp. CNCTC7651]UIZ92444.1 hypothetical protein JZY91_01140 [Corynebacterium sp. CNCTC7651]
MRKAWWVAAPVAVAAMLAASAQPYFSLYRPWAWTQEHVVRADSAGSFSLPLPDAGEGAAHAASVEVVGFQLLDDATEQRIGVHAPDGFDAWLVMTQWSAPADAVLVGCRMWATGSDGRTYNLTDGVFADSALVEDLSQASACTPPREGGPRIDPADGSVAPGDPRPEKWRKITPVAMPEGIQPTHLRFGWQEPHYVTLVLPAPADFVDAPAAS